MEIAWNSSEHIWPPRPGCSCHSLVACVLQRGLARRSASPRVGHICWERKEMCCAPAGLLVWITGIATESGKNICPAMKTCTLWYTDKNFGMMKATSLETHTTATATSKGPDALSHKLLWLCYGNTDSMDCCCFVETIWAQEVQNSSPSLCFLGRDGALKTMAEILE